MKYRWATLVAIAILGLILSPSALACSFQKVGESDVSYTLPDGTEYNHHTDYYAWVNCGTSGPSEPYYDPNPAPGGDYGPPAPPPPPAPPTTEACQLCQDQCWAEFAICLSSEADRSWFGYCGILCRESCRVARDICIGDGCVSSNQC